MAVASISEYSASINTPQMIKASILMGGGPVKKNGRLLKYAGGFCVVFPYTTSSKKYAVRCWHVNIDNIRRRSKLIAEAIHSYNLPYFVGFEYVQNGLQTAQGAQDIVVMDWVEAHPLKIYIAKHIHNSSKLIELADHFKKMVIQLHNHEIAHGDLQHGNILVKDDGQIVLVDYDSMYVGALSGCEDTIKGIPGYQHPSRWENKHLNKKLDYFSEIIIYTSLLALAKYPHLWDILHLEDTETLLFTAEDISSKGASRIFQFLEKDPELHPISYKIRDFLRKDDINSLEPLEKAVRDYKEELLSELSSTWTDNGYVNNANETINLTEIAKYIAKSW